MIVHTNKILGRGSKGTIVFLGLWDSRKVAVKRLLIDANEEMDDIKSGKNGEGLSIEKEIQLLISSDHLPNIVRYHAKEEDGDFIYLALEFCPRTLFDFVTDKKGHSIKSAISTIHGMVSGLRQLHDLNVVHRDLKPRNILLSSKGKAKIGDMGLGKKLSKHRSSFDSRVCGSVGWQPAEMIKVKSTRVGERLTKAVDIFSAGCIIYYALTKGGHPFGTEPEREYNILHGRADLSGLNEIPLAKDLVFSMISPTAEDRISALDAESHPLFWDDDKRLSFLQDVSDRIVKPDSYALCGMIESKAAQVVGTNWNKRLDPEILTDLGKYRKYNFTSVGDCLRVIRNKRNHYFDLPKPAQRKLGELPSGFLRYFSSRFPQLLIHSYRTIGSFYAYKMQMAKMNGNTMSFETFGRYYKNLSDRRLKLFTEQVQLKPCRGWLPRAAIWQLGR